MRYAYSLLAFLSLGLWTSELAAQAAAVAIDHADSRVQVTVVGEPGQHYRLEYAFNLGVGFAEVPSLLHVGTGAEQTYTLGEYFNPYDSPLFFRLIEAPVYDAYELGELTSSPTLIGVPHILYPVRMRMQRITGEVVLIFVIGVNGRITDVEIAKSTHPDFTASVLAALPGMLFTPGTVNGVPVAVRVRQPIPFTLN